MQQWVAENLILRPAYFVLREPVLEFLATFGKTQWLPPRELEEYQLKHLRNVLRHSNQKVRYYQRRWRDKQIDAYNIDDFASFFHLPVLTRDDIRANWTELRADRKYRSARSEIRTTSGSSGQPLTIEKDRIATGAMNAVMWRSYGWFDMRMGDPQGRIWFGGLSAIDKCKVAFGDSLLNRIRLSPLQINVKILDAFVEKMRRFRPRYLYGYGQSLHRLAAHVLDSQIDLAEIQLRAIVTTAEKISGQQKMTIEAAFQTRVVDEYGCTEVGIIAMECPKGRMHLMADNLVVEIVRDGQPVAHGEEGEILVTELYSSSMPLIRYKVGDRGVLSKDLCPCGRGLPVLEKFSGRLTDLIVCPDGTTVDPDTVNTFLMSKPEFFKAVRQWKVCQAESEKILITLCTSQGTSRPDIEVYLKNRFSALWNEQMDIEFTYAEWLEPESSGKTRMFHI